MAAAKVNLPVSYVDAKGALAKCTRVDECRTWANKAAALASYAKQMSDESLENMAKKIRARAIQRGGELLAQVKAQNRGDHKSKGRQVPMDRKTAAKAAGLSPDQAKTMLRVANVPKHQFELLVEADKPATVERLAEIGTKKKPSKPAPSPYRNAYLDWAHAIRHLAALPACGLDVLVEHGPYSSNQLLKECNEALQNLNLWNRTLERAHVKAEEKNNAA